MLSDGERSAADAGYNLVIDCLISRRYCRAFQWQLASLFKLVYCVGTDFVYTRRAPSSLRHIPTCLYNPTHWSLYSIHWTSVYLATYMPQKTWQFHLLNNDPCTSICKFRESSQLDIQQGINITYLPSPPLPCRLEGFSKPWGS